MRWSPLFEWFDRRTGIHTLLHEALDEPIPGGARLAYVFGSGLLFLFVSQVITGVLLALYYVPSADHAHVTVAYIAKVVTSGSFLRSMHAYGASAMIIVLGLHLGQVFLYGSYKVRRELLWLAGCILFFLILGMTFTGYLLPWDQKAYFATTVGTNILSEVPYVGNGLRLLLRGGESMGTLTLSRFYVLHVFLIPALIFAFVTIHVYLFRQAGAAGPPAGDPQILKKKTERFYPRQVLMDLAFLILLTAALAMLAHFKPVELGPPANPADTQYLPRPEWYFRPVFEWLQYWKGSWEIMGILVIPLLVVLLLVALPFIDRSPERRPWKRPAPVSLFAAFLFSFVALGTVSYWKDAHDLSVATQLHLQLAETDEYMRSPFKPFRIGSVVLTRTSPSNPLLAQGKEVFETQGCNSCHGDDGVGTAIAPRLIGIGSRFSSDELASHIRHPTERMTRAGMPSFDIPSDKMEALVGYLDSLK